MTSTDRHALIGYFAEATQTEPAYDPPHDGPCLVCWQPLTPGDVRTVSLAPGEAARASVFYRVHASCADTPEAELVEQSIIGREFAYV